MKELLCTTRYLNNKGVIEQLIGAGAALDIKRGNFEGETALHIAVVKGYVDTVKALINAGANLNIQDNNGSTPSVLLLL